MLISMQHHSAQRKEESILYGEPASTGWHLPSPQAKAASNRSRDSMLGQGPDRRLRGPCLPLSLLNQDPVEACPVCRSRILDAHWSARARRLRRRFGQQRPVSICDRSIHKIQGVEQVGFCGEAESDETICERE